MCFVIDSCTFCGRQYFEVEIGGKRFIIYNILCSTHKQNHEELEDLHNKIAFEDHVTSNKEFSCPSKTLCCSQWSIHWWLNCYWAGFASAGWGVAGA